MDGTLLDLNFDNVFWREIVPRRYASLRGMSVRAAQQALAPRFEAKVARSSGTASIIGRAISAWT